MDLSKPDKKTARELIEKGLQKDYVIQLKKYDKILTEWKSGKLTPEDAYKKMTVCTEKSIEYIDNRYSYVTGSHYFDVVFQLYLDNMIDIEDINRFSTEISGKLKQLKESW